MDETVTGAGTRTGQDQTTPAGGADGDRAATFRHAVEAFNRGDLRRTAEACRRLVEADGDDAPAWHLLGCVQGRSGRAAEAARCFQQAVRRAPTNAGYLVNLGSALIDLGQFADAIAVIERALATVAAGGDGVHPRVLPDAVEKLTTAHVRLGDRLLAQNEVEAARAHYRAALKRGGATAGIHGRLGKASALLGDVGATVGHYRDAMLLDPGSIACAQALGTALFRAGRLDEAIRLLDDLIRRFPDSPNMLESYCNLGVCLEARHQDELALTQFQRAIARFPQSPEPLRHACRALLTLGRVDDAEAMLQRLIALDPDHRDRLTLEGSLLAVRGNIEAAHVKLRAAVRDPGSPVSCLGPYAATCVDLGRSEEAVPVLTDAVARQADPHDRAKLQFQLGALHDSLGNWDMAFAAFAEANRFHAGRTPFDAAAVRAWTDTMIAVFAPDRFAALPRSRQDSRLPVFIVGMPRSGTSLVEQILACHPLAHGAGELPDIDVLSRTLPETLGSRDAYPRCLAGADADLLDRVAGGYLEALRSHAPAAARISDKMPGNVRHLGLIALLFPQATIIHCRRDPVDTCLSCYFQDFRSVLAFSFDLERLAVYYREYRRLVHHWTGALGLPVVDVRYEDLAADPEPQIRRLIDSVGLPWDDRCLRFFDNDRVVQTASRQQVRKPMYTSSIGRWKAYAAHLGPLLDGLAEFR